MSASNILIELQAISKINFNQYVDFLPIQLKVIRSFLPGVYESDTLTEQGRKVKESLVYFIILIFVIISNMTFHMSH